MVGSVPDSKSEDAHLLQVHIFFLLLCIIACLSLSSPLLATETPPQAVMLEISGSINPAVSDYVRYGLERAVTSGAGLVILQMDTPGGLDRSMRDIIQRILASPLPVASYIAPEGARAASAGTYILYASHIAAMSPATNLGAATPVSLGGMPGSQPPSDKKKAEDDSTTDDASIMKHKVINDASAYIRALAELRGRNVEWAERAVREAVSLSAEEALEQGVIEFVAKDPEDLLAQLNGFEIRLNSKPYRISTENMIIITMKPTWRHRLLAVISDPNVAYFLLLLGFYGLVFELTTPGVYLPGVAGGISLLLAFYAFQILPINYSGLALILLGMALLIGESFLPSFGALGIGGLAAFFMGSLILIDDEGLQISLSVIAATTAVAAVLVLLVLGRLLTTRRKKIITGDEALLGMIGEASDDFDGDGRVELSGELWLAESSEKIRKGEKVRIISRDGLQLKVERLNSASRKDNKKAHQGESFYTGQ